MFQYREPQVVTYKGEVRKVGNINTLVDFDVVLDINGTEVSIMKLLSVSDLRSTKVKFLEAFESHQEGLKKEGYTNVEH